MTISLVKSHYFHKDNSGNPVPATRFDMEIGGVGYYWAETDSDPINPDLHKNAIRAATVTAEKIYGKTPTEITILNP